MKNLFRLIYEPKEKNYSLIIIVVFRCRIFWIDGIMRFPSLIVVINIKMAHSTSMWNVEVDNNHISNEQIHTYSEQLKSREIYFLEFCYSATKNTSDTFIINLPMILFMINQFLCWKDLPNKKISYTTIERRRRRKKKKTVKKFVENESHISFCIQYI